MPRPTGRQALLRARLAPLAALLLVALAVGGWLADDYGMSWDEERNYTVGFDALQSYLDPGRYHDYLAQGDPLSHHGPAYFMFFGLLSRGLVGVAPGWHIADGRHLSNYLVFLLGLASFYFLALRVVPRRYALMTTALVLTQPLLFGHAFINQKDTPFMALFLASVAAGMAAIDAASSSFRRAADSSLHADLLHEARGEWKATHRTRRTVALLYLAISLLWLAYLAIPTSAAADVAVWLHDLGRMVATTAWALLGVLMVRWVWPITTRLARARSRPKLGWGRTRRSRARPHHFHPSGRCLCRTAGEPVRTEATGQTGPVAAVVDTRYRRPW